MIALRSDIWLCQDCTVFACNGDLSGVSSDERALAVEAGAEKLGPHLVPDFDSETGRGMLEHSIDTCQCCGTPWHGARWRFSILGEPKPETDSPVPNFDAMTQAELRAFWGKYHLATRKHVREFMGLDDSSPVPRELVNGLRTLAAYALDKSCAMKLRLEGKIQQAMGYEGSCDERYSRLPEAFRW